MTSQTLYVRQIILHVAGAWRDEVIHLSKITGCKPTVVFLHSSLQIYNGEWCGRFSTRALSCELAVGLCVNWFSSFYIFSGASLEGCWKVLGADNSSMVCRWNMRISLIKHPQASTMIHHSHSFRHTRWKTWAQACFGYYWKTQQITRPGWGGLTSYFALWSCVEIKPFCC